MSDGTILAAIGALILTIIGAAAGAIFSSSAKRRDDEKRRNGERMGVLEEWVNFERGRRAGLEEASRKDHAK